MGNKFLRILFLLVFSFPLFAFFVQAQDYGLSFNSMDVSLDKRTELNLTPNGFLKFQDEFEISFDYKTTRINPDNFIGFFGYVFRIINKADHNIDLLSTPNPDLQLNLVLGRSNAIIPVEYSENAINKWTRIRVKFFLADDKLAIYTPDTFYVRGNVGFERSDAFKIIFGANDYKHFRNSDVPSMAVRNIEISEKGKRRYHWPLNEEAGRVAIDRIKGKKAKVINPTWLRLNHQNWQKIFDDELKGIVCVAVDEAGGKIFLVGQEKLAVFSAKDNDIQEVRYQNAPFLFSPLVRAVFNSNDEKIYCYLAHKGPCYSLDPNTGEWDQVISSGAIDRKFRHHNAFFYDSSDQIYLMGGYGQHQYNNRLINIDLKTKKWVELPTNDSVFFPRYLAGLGALNDTLYVLGGYGSKSGNQLINPHSYFDLFGYAIKDSTFFKKFEIPHLIEDMIVGNSMWIDKSNRNYYALIFSKVRFESALQLIRGNLNSPDVERVGDEIPFKFLDVRSFSDLDYFPKSKKLFSYTSYYTDSTTQLAIYSIDYPPVKMETAQMSSPQSDRSVFLFLFIALIFLSGGVILAFIRRKTISKKGEVSGRKEVTPQVPSPVPSVEKWDYNIVLFGGFQVFNKNFEDITFKFPPLLKELFLLILLHSLKNDKGISSEKITETLWFDKSVKSARNNRAVNIAKLRSILEEIGECELSKRTGYWKIFLEGSDIRCDYIDFLDITASKTGLTKQKVIRLKEISQKGAFLENVHYDWLDDFKASVSDNIVETLMAYGHSADITAEAELIIRIADCVFNFDIVNEEAMNLKCQAEYHLGRHSLARNTYEKFFREYLAMYGKEYQKSFHEIIEKNA